MLPPISVFFDKKQILREKMRAERKAAAKARPDAAVHAARNFMATIDISEKPIVAIYYPINHELDTEPLAEALHEKGVTLALPVFMGPAQPLMFRRYKPGRALLRGAFGVKEPFDSEAVVIPAIVVTPLLAFDRTGGRLGYGGGCYDRTLWELRPNADFLAVGYAYSAQEVDALPLTPLDQPLDWIVTEGAAIRC